MARYCEFCGKYSGKYPLCKECYALAEDGEIEQCDDCGEWHYADDYCDCEIAFVEENKCLICKKDCGDNFLCKNCYYQNKNKTLYFKVKVNSEMNFEYINRQWTGIFTSEDGHVVKSMAEREIDDWLWNNNIKHIYEPEYTALGTTNTKIHPDWCLPAYIKDTKGKDVDVYIEYWGIENDEKYEAIKQYKLPIYKKDKLTLICINGTEDIKNIKAVLETKLRRKENIKPYTINFYKK